jgi:hypothetical protein
MGRDRKKKVGCFGGLGMKEVTHDYQIQLADQFFPLLQITILG